MLQWMGGSRRKMTTYRNSTRKRQRHYFEERKRKQQQEAGYESYSNGKQSCIQNYEDNRSLDLLSLVNISAVTTENSASDLNDARESSEDDDVTLSNQFNQSPSASVRTEITVAPCRLNEGISPTFISEPICPKGLPDHNQNISQHGGEVDHSKISTMHRTMSIIDLLGDMGDNSKAEENSQKEKEPHVAFSVEGLGKVETHTPVQSPDAPHRASQHGSHFPKKTRKQPVTSKHFDFGFDDLDSQFEGMSQDNDFSTHVSSGKRCLFPKDSMGFDCYPESNFLTLRDSQLNRKDIHLQSFLDDDGFLYSIPNSTRNKNTWNEGSCFLDNNFDEVEEPKSFYEDWQNIESVCKNDLVHSKNSWKQEFNFDAWNLPRKSSSLEGNGNIYLADSPVLTKHYTMDLPDTFISDTTWYSPSTIDNKVRDSIQRFVTEDTKDRSSLLSEESCSSAAVWCDTLKKSGEN